MKFKFIKYLLANFFLLSTVIFLGLSSSIEAQQKTNPKILITFAKNEELGLAYSAQIYTDGTVIYEGKSFEVAKGKRKYKISQNKINELIREFKRVNYFSLKDSYNQSLDGGSTNTSISLGGKQKKIINGGGPKELYELENRIIEIAGFDDFYITLKRRIDVFFERLNRDSNSNGVIVNYGTPKKITLREGQIKQAANFRGYDLNRVKFVRRVMSRKIKTEFKIINANNEKEIPRNN